MVTGYLLLPTGGVSWKMLSFFLLVELFILSSFIALGAGAILPLLIAAVLFVSLSIRYPLAWISTVIIFHLLILQRSEEITIWEVFFGIYFFGGITLWFARKLFLGLRIIKSRADLYILFFMGIAFLSVIPAVMHSTSLLKWFRELIVFLSYLMYFPIRDALSGKKSLIVIGVSFIILAASIAIDNLSRYQSAATSAIYAWQLLSGRQTANEPLFLTSILISIALFLHVKPKIIKTLLLVIIIFFSVALIFTFSRGYWIGAMTGIVILLFLVQGKHRFRMLMTLIIIGITIISVIFLIFNNLGSSILQTIGSRFAVKSLSVSADPSLLTRAAETNTVIRLIISNPILGHGLGSLFKFYSPLEGHIVETWYIHNGYLFLWFKFGIVGLVLFLLAYGSMIRDAYLIMKKRIGSFQGNLLAGIISLLISMLVISITSPQFITRDSILIIGICWAIIGAWRYQDVNCEV